MRQQTLIILLLLTSSCTDISGTKEIKMDFPQKAILLAEAKGTYHTLSIECKLDLLIIKEEKQPSIDSIFVTMGGGATRNIFNENDDGVGFLANIFDRFTISFLSEGEFEMKSRVFEIDEPQQFFEEFSYFEGVETSSGHWEGTWNCYPLQTREDTVGVVRGTWIIEQLVEDNGS